MTIEGLWHGLKPPYAALFDWLDGTRGNARCRRRAGVPPADAGASARGGRSRRARCRVDIAAEWKWDGIRVQVAAGRGETRLYSRTGDDIGKSFPDLLAGFRFEAVLDGELLVVRDGVVAPFNDLQQRLNRKSVTARMLTQYPPHIRFYDVLEIAGEDLRALPWSVRRTRLEAWHAETKPPHTDLSALIAFDSLEALRRHLGGHARYRHRGHDAEAARQRLSHGSPEGALVEVEARRADSRLRAAVRAARLRQALVVLFGLHVRLLERRRRWRTRPWSPSARPIPVSPTRN